MKPFYFKILFLVAFSSAFSQTKETIIKRSFDATENMVLNIDVDNVSIIFEESLDNKIHVDYSIIFGRYSKRKRGIITKQVKQKISAQENLINIDVKSSMFLGQIYRVNVSPENFLVSMKDYLKNYKNRKVVYKSKDSLLKEIGFSEGSNFRDYLKKRNPKDYASIKNKKIIVQKFVVKVPKYIKLRVKALHSNLLFKYDINESISLNTFKGFLKFKDINTKQAKFNLINGTFQAKNLKGGEFNLKDVGKVAIGSISDTKIDSEASNIQIGEINKDVIINDFNSKLYLFNYGKQFSQFNLEGDFSKIYMYNIDQGNYLLDAFGLNTALKMNGVEATFGDSKEKKFTKILEKRKSDKRNLSGKITIKLQNGILEIQ